MVREFISKIEEGEQQIGLDIIIGCSGKIDVLRCNSCLYYESSTKTRSNACWLRNSDGVYPTINEKILEILE